jgi:hypothetical protein
MAYIQYLIFDGEKLPLPESYDVEMKDVESDSSGETEAGTMQRDVVRYGVYTISVNFNLSPMWLQKFSTYKRHKSINVVFFDPVTLDAKEAEMFMDSYKAVLVKDTSYKGLWKVSFTLREF